MRRAGGTKGKNSEKKARHRKWVYIYRLRTIEDKEKKASEYTNDKRNSV